MEPQHGSAMCISEEKQDQDGWRRGRREYGGAGREGERPQEARVKTSDFILYVVR